MDVGVPELLIILLIVVIFFGVGRLPELGGAVGKSIKEFRKAAKEITEEDTTKSSDEEKSESQ